MGFRLRLARLGLGLAALCALSCGRPAPPNVVVITLDTTRADRLGAYGYGAARTPSFDRFAASGVLYEQAYSTAPWTLPSHASIFTGLLPMQHGAQTTEGEPVGDLWYGVRPLADRFTTLAELFRDAGFQTAGVIGGPALGPELGVAQGFDYYEADFSQPLVKYAGKRAAFVADRAIALVDTFGEKPFFLFVNFFDPHAPYKPPAPWSEGLGETDDPAVAPGLVTQAVRGDAPVPVDAIDPSLRDGLARMSAGYDAEIAYMDHHLGRLLAAIEASPRADATFVAITGDHGESFGEHFYVSHGAHLYEHAIRVPFAVRRPARDGDGAEAGTRVAVPVENRRLFWMALDAAGIEPPAEAPRLSEDGGPLVTEVRRSSNTIRLFGDFFDRDQRALYDPPWKLIEDTRGDVQLYDLARDPAELRDRAETDPETRDRLAATLRAVEEAHPPLFEEEARAELGPDTEEALRALGYIE